MTTTMLQIHKDLVTIIILLSGVFILTVVNTIIK